MKKSEIEYKDCPNCGMPIPKSAKICPHCKRVQPQPYSKPVQIIVAIIIIVVLIIGII